MRRGKVIPSDITVSAIVHLSLLGLLLLFSDVHRFSSVSAETIAIDIVTPSDVTGKEPETTLTPLDLSPIEKPPFVSEPVAAQSPSPARSQHKSAAAPDVAPQQAVAPPPQPASPNPAYRPPEPDLSIKYQVMLGLPQDMSQTMPPTPQRSVDKAGDNFDAPAERTADVASSLVAEFRRHLRACSKLPASLRATDDVKVTLRVLMTPDGRLATDPILVEASASMKGPLLMQGAISALQACQPYAMLPADRYGEWKVLDLGFTPRDFAS